MWLQNIVFLFLLTLSRGEFIFDMEEDTSEEIQGDNPFILDGALQEEQDDVQTLHFSSTNAARSLRNLGMVYNFPNLEELYIENANLTNIPLLANLPSLVKLSFMKNQLEVINNASVNILSLQILFLARNRIHTIFDAAFGPKMKEVYLTCNNLTSISSKWFTRPEALILLNLGGNKIRTVPENMFNKFVNLKYLDLRLNNLKTLEDNSLSGPLDMTILQLGYNNLTEISPNVFGNATGKFFIKYLDIRYNWMTYLSDETLNKLKVENFRMWANPWQCACKHKIKNWWTKVNNNNTKDLAFDYSTPCIRSLIFPDTCIHINEDYVYEEFNKIFLPQPIKLCA